MPVFTPEPTRTYESMTRTGGVGVSTANHESGARQMLRLRVGVERRPDRRRPVVHVGRDGHRRAAQRHHVDACAQCRDPVDERVVGPGVHQCGHHVVRPRVGTVQRGDRVEDGAAGAQLVVDQHQGAVAAQQARVGGQ